MMCVMKKKQVKATITDGGDTRTMRISGGTFPQKVQQVQRLWEKNMPRKGALGRSQLSRG